MVDICSCVFAFLRVSPQAELEKVDALSPFGVYQGLTIGIARELREDCDYENHFLICWGFVDQIEGTKFKCCCHGNDIRNSGLLVFPVF